MIKRDPFQDYYNCTGHYHRKIDGLMVNPYTGAVAPDQWCGNVKPDPTYTPQRIQRDREVNRNMAAYALWCKLGKHAFDPDDEGAEEFTRTVKVKNRYNEMQEQTKAFSVCSEHLNSTLAAKVIESNAESNAESVSEA